MGAEEPSGGGIYGEGVSGRFAEIGRGGTLSGGGWTGICDSVPESVRSNGIILCRNALYAVGQFTPLWSWQVQLGNRKKIEW